MSSSPHQSRRPFRGRLVRCVFVRLVTVGVVLAIPSSLLAAPTAAAQPLSPVPVVPVSAAQSEADASALALALALGDRVEVLALRDEVTQVQG